MGTIKTTNIEPIADNGTVTLGSSGDTFTVPSGVTIANSGTATGFGGDNTPAFLAFPSSAQSIPNNTNTTVVLDSEVYDTDNAFASNTFTVPSGEGGKYLFYFKVRQNGNTQNRLYAYLEASISGSTSDFYTTENGGGGSYDSVQATGVINMSAGDTVVLKFYQNCGSSNNIFSSLNHVHFGGHKLIGI